MKNLRSPCKFLERSPSKSIRSYKNCYPTPSLATVVPKFIDLTADINAEVDLTQEVSYSCEAESPESREGDDEFNYSSNADLTIARNQNFKLEFPTTSCNRQREGRGAQKNIGNYCLSNDFILFSR